MRTDVTETLNANLEAQAVYLEQVISFYQSEILKMQAMVIQNRQRASKEAHEADPVIDAKPMAFPAIAKPKPAGEEYRKQGQGTMQAPVGATRIQNDGQSYAEASRKLEAAVSGAV